MGHDSRPVNIFYDLMLIIFLCFNRAPKAQNAIINLKSFIFLTDSGNIRRPAGKEPSGSPVV
jgi:hypothetical protein